MYRYLFIFLFLISNITYVAAETTRYDLEAAFVYKFIKFVDWPGSLENEEVFDLCYTGSGEIKSSIMALNDSEIKNIILEVKMVDNLSDLKDCELLFIDLTNKKDRKKHLDFLSASGVLTVSHFEGFLEDGGMINLILSNSRIQFEINFNSAEKSNIKVSSKLLRLASRVIASK